MSTPHSAAVALHLAAFGVTDAFAGEPPNILLIVSAGNGHINPVTAFPCEHCD